MGRGKSLVKNTGIIAFGTFLVKMSNIITLPIITGKLTQAEYGTYDLISTLVLLFLPVMTLQLQSAAFRFLIDCRNDENETKRIISNIYAFTLPVSLVALSFLYLFLSSVNFIIRILICFYFFTDLLIITTQQIVRGLSYNGLYVASAILQSLVNVAVIILSVSLWDKGLIGVLLSMIIATLSGVYLLIKKGKIIGKIDLSMVSKEVLKELLSYSWPMIPNSISLWVLSASDRLVLTVFLGVEANAVYAVANKIPALFTTVQGSFVYAWQENASMAAKDEDAMEYYSFMFANIYTVLSGIIALVIAVAPLLFIILIKGEYVESYSQMPILFLGVFFSALSAFMGGIYVAHKRTKSVGITTLLAAGLNLAIDIICVHIIGIYAASISTLVSYLFLFVFRVIDVNKFQKIRFNILKMLTYLSVLIGMCVFFNIHTVQAEIINVFIGFIFAVAINYKTIKGIISLSKEKWKNRKMHIG